MHFNLCLNIQASRSYLRNEGEAVDIIVAAAVHDSDLGFLSLHPLFLPHRHCPPPVAHLAFQMALGLRVHQMMLAAVQPQCSVPQSL